MAVPGCEEGSRRPGGTGRLVKTAGCPHYSCRLVLLAFRPLLTRCPLPGMSLTPFLFGQTLGAIALKPLSLHVQCSSCWGPQPPILISPQVPIPFPNARAAESQLCLPRPGSGLRGGAGSASSLHHQCPTQAGRRAGTWRGLVEGDCGAVDPILQGCLGKKVPPGKPRVLR